MTLKWQFDFRCCCLSTLSPKVLAFVNTSKKSCNCICLAAMDDTVKVGVSIQTPFILLVRHSPRSRRHQVAVASHIFVKSESVIFMWLSRSRQSYSCRLKSVIYVVAAATSENCNTKIKTKFVSLIAKLQNKTCCWFYSFTLFTGTAVQPYNIVAYALLFGIYGNIGTSHVMSTMSSICWQLGWHLCVNTVLMWVMSLFKTVLLLPVIEEQMSNVTGT